MSNSAAAPAAAPAGPADKVNLEKAPLKQVLSTLGADQAVGLTTTEVSKRLAKYGPNSMPEKHVSTIRKLLGYLTGPISYMIEAAAIVSAIIGHWEDFAIIVALLAFNTSLDFLQDKKATSALAALKAGLALDATVMRDGSWTPIKADQLVPGDIVKIRLGMIVPADMRLVAGDYASIDQAALTGESVPVSKKVGDLAYSGSVVRQGEMTGVVIGTGLDTYLGRTAKLVAGAGAVSHAQKAMFSIGNFLIILAVVLVVILIVVQVYRQMVVSHDITLSYAAELLQLVLVLLVASIPVAMPAVFSVTMALGAFALSKQGAIVSRLESIEEMAGVDILCSDKTGTLTKNELTIGTPIKLGSTDAAGIIQCAALASQASSGDPIDNAVLAAVADPKALALFKQVKFVPFDPVTKRTEATLTDQSGKTIHTAKGAPQAIAELAGLTGDSAKTVNDDVTKLAEGGFRALGVAKSADGEHWDFLGILPMSDPPRDDSKSTIAKAREKGLAVKMVTGDDTAIAKQIAGEIGIGTNILAADTVFPEDMDPDNLPEKTRDIVERADGFARVFPQHKYAIVKALQQRGHLTAMTGDGVNDAPALKQADCGIAVSGAVDAARSAAALILTRPGLSTINSAIDDARQIFGRITSYIIYRIALTLDIMFLVVTATIFFGLVPLTAVMIVIISLFDDIPIMAIAYDNTEISPEPIRWRMKKIMTVSSILGFFSVVQSLGWLMFGAWVISDPQAANTLNLHDTAHLQTLVFLQLVVGGHLLLLITRTSRWYFQRPFPSWQLLSAIAGTQVLVMLICGFGWLVPSISWSLIGLTWAYNLLWMLILGPVRLMTERLQESKIAGRRRHMNFITGSLFPFKQSGGAGVAATAAPGQSPQATSTWRTP